MTGLPRIAMVGRLGTPQLACLRSWRRRDLDCLFVHADRAPLPWAVQRGLGVPCVQLGAATLDDDAVVQRLAAALAAHRIDAVTCVSEPLSEALWAARPKLPPGVQVLGVRPEQVRVLESKVRQDALARRCGLPVLPSWQFLPGDLEAVQRPPDEAFPLVLRPDVAQQVQPAFKVQVVADRAALERFVAGLAPSSCGVIAQPLVRGPNLLVHGFRSADGRVHGHVAFRVEVKHRGFTVVMRPVPLRPEIAAGCARVEAALGLTGVFHYEFIEDAASGRLAFLDLNPRFGGTTGKALAAGYDEPLALLACARPGMLPAEAFVAPRLRSAGGAHQALRALAGALGGSSTAADYPYPDRARLMRELGRWLLQGRDEVLRPEALRSLVAFGAYQILKRAAAR